MSENKTFLIDPPIASKKEDLLNRAPIAKIFAKTIIEQNESSSFVIGIEGTWGSGKTSFIELAIEEIYKQTKDVKIIKFNPWNFTNIDALYIEFFSQLGAALEDNKAIKEYVNRLTSVVKPSINLPFLQFTLDFTKNLGDFRKKIEKVLVNANYKIIIIIDDIDRLSINDTREIFRLVKVNADFPRITYLLAYDRPKVEKILTEDGFPGSEYLKKIVQVNFPIPEPSSQQLYTILSKEVDKTLNARVAKRYVDQLWEDKRWGNLFHEGFKSLFVTIRDIKRFISAWRLNYKMIGYAEVNPVDFLGIEAIKVFAPSTYSAIRENKSLFTATHSSGYSSSRDDKEISKKLYNEIISQSDVSIQGHIDKICRQLFPQTEGFLGNMSYGHDWYTEWRQKLRVCSQDIFDIYFALSISTHRVSQIEIESQISKLDQKGKFQEYLLKINDSLKLRGVLDQLMDKIETLNNTKILYLLLALSTVGDTTDDDQKSNFNWENAESKIRRLMYHAIKKIEGTERVKMLKKLLTTTGALYTPSYLAGYLIKEYEDKEEKPESTDEPLITNKQDIEGLKKLILTKIETASKTGQLINSRNLAALIAWWNRWATNRKPPKDFILKSIKNKSDFFKLLASYKYITSSQTLGDHVATITENIGIKDLSDYGVLDDIKVKASLYKKDKLTKRQKEILNLLEKEIQKNAQDPE